jgi:hypothetical protein
VLAPPEPAVPVWVPVPTGAVPVGALALPAAVVPPCGAVAPGAVVPAPGALAVAPGAVALAPGAVVPAPGAVVPAPGTALPGALPVPIAGVGVVTAGAATAGVVTVLVTATVLVEPSGSPASETSAAVSAPRESTITVANAITGARQLGVAASRVRAAAPQRRHHSWSAPNAPPHSGQLSATGLPGAFPGAIRSGPHSPAGPCSSGLGEGGAATLTSRRPAGG